jgi:hypothetical protein
MSASTQAEKLKTSGGEVVEALNQNQSIKLNEIQNQSPNTNNSTTTMMTTEMMNAKVQADLKTYEPTRANGVINEGCEVYTRPLPCKTPCEKRTMNGRSWWKLQGYNSICACAWDALETSLMRKLIQEEQWRIQKIEWEKRDAEPMECDECSEMKTRGTLSRDQYDDHYCEECWEEKYDKCDCCDEPVAREYCEADDEDPYLEDENEDEKCVCEGCREEFLEEVQERLEERKRRRIYIKDQQALLVKLCKENGIEETIMNMGATWDIDEAYEHIYGGEGSKNEF